MSKDPTEKVYLCKSCGKLSAAEHLCSPIGIESVSCPYCGKAQGGNLHMCSEKLTKSEFSCSACGRVSVESISLCSPEKII